MLAKEPGGPPTKSFMLVCIDSASRAAMGSGLLRDAPSPQDLLTMLVASMENPCLATEAPVATESPLIPQTVVRVYDRLLYVTSDFARQRTGAPAPTGPRHQGTNGLMDGVLPPPERAATAPAAPAAPTPRRIIVPCPPPVFADFGVTGDGWGGALPTMLPSEEIDTSCPLWMNEVRDPSSSMMPTDP